MREILKRYFDEIHYWVYGVTENEFSHVRKFVNEILQARKKEYDVYKARMRRDSPDIADDILDDVGYYRDIDETFLWHFALWRLQGLLEASIVYRFLPKQKKVIGLSRKLGAMRKAGFSISDSEIEELESWGKLRNALSHAPPEQFRPVPLNENDISEYENLIVSFFQRWKLEAEKQI